MKIKLVMCAGICKLYSSINCRIIIFILEQLDSKIQTKLKKKNIHRLLFQNRNIPALFRRDCFQVISTCCVLVDYSVSSIQIHFNNVHLFIRLWHSMASSQSSYLIYLWSDSNHLSEIYFFTYTQNRIVMKFCCSANPWPWRLNTLASNSKSYDIATHHMFGIWFRIEINSEVVHLTRVEWISSNWFVIVWSDGDRCHTHRTKQMFEALGEHSIEQ